MSKKTSLQSGIKQLEGLLDKYFVKKAPSLPKNWKKFLVSATPYLVLVSVVFGFFSSLSLFGMMGFFGPMGYYGRMMMGSFSRTQFLLDMTFLLVTLVLEGLAISGLFKKTKKSWRLLFYASLVSAVYNLLNLNLFVLVIGIGVSLYFLFQIKEYYKN